MTWGAIADDLTGANALAALVVAHGGVACTLLGPEPAAFVSGVPLLVLDTASRDLDAPAAAAATVMAARRLARHGADRLVKRIDSTLRGHIRAEMSALLDAGLGLDLALVCPAAPAAGRSMVDGHLYLHGRRLSESSGLADDVRRVLSPKDPGAVPLLSLDLLRAGDDVAAAWLRAQVRSGVRLVAADAERDADLAALARAVMTSGLCVLPADPGGFTLHLLHGGTLPRAAPAAVTSERLNDVTAGILPSPGSGAPAPITQGIMLAVLGSRTAVTERQTAAATAWGMGLVQLDRSAVMGDARLPDAEVRRAVRRVLALSARTTAIGLRVGGADSKNAGPSGSPPLPDEQAASELQVAELLAEVTAAVLGHGIAVRGLFLTGGATARAVLDRLGATAMAIEGEVLPLAARGRLLGGQLAGLCVITKGGLVGDSDGIIRCLSC